MARSVDFIQIVYDTSQIKYLYDFAGYHYNNKLTSLFENEVIKFVVPECKADLVSVCSWRLKAKRGDMLALGGRELTYQKITETEYDIAILTPRSPTHKMLTMSANWHGKAWIDCIKILRKFIKIPEEVKTPIYENHFIATREIYQEYVEKMLKPVIEYCSQFPEFMAPSGYAARKRAQPEERQRIKDQIGMDDWPMLPFVLERLFSIWINDKNFKITVL